MHSALPAHGQCPARAVGDKRLQKVLEQAGHAGRLSDHNP
jgi:hypothetical protein